MPQKTTSHRLTTVPSRFRSLQLPEFTAAHGGDGGLGATTDPPLGPLWGQTQKGQNIGNMGMDQYLFDIH